MQPDPVGLALAAAAAALCLFGARATLSVSLGCLVFMSTAVVSLPALGGASIGLPQVGLVCLGALFLARRGSLGRAIETVARVPAAQALLLFAVYAAASAVLNPRLFQGETPVFTLARVAETIIRVPLAPSSGNVTQTLYLLSGICAFFFVTAIVRDASDYLDLARAFRAYVVLNVAFGLVDALGKYGLGRDVLAFLRTANYTMLADVDIGGVWRLAGTYPEASMFALAGSGQIALCHSLWRSGLGGGVWGGAVWPALLVALVGLVILSTSSSAYVFLVLFAAGIGLLAAREAAAGRVGRTTLWLAAAAAAGLAGMLGAAAASEGVLRFVADMADTLLLEKMSSASGVERSSWNAQAIQNLVDTAGAGIGLGSARSSSWALSLLAQLGIPGTALYAAFVACLVGPASLRRELGARAPAIAAIRRAFLAYLFALMLAASISWPLVDLGPQFFVAAAMVAVAGRVGLAPAPAARVGAAALSPARS